MRNVLVRDWRPHLTLAERDFLAWLFDNTIEWGRTVLDATLDQMLKGVPSAHPEWTWSLPPVGLPRRTLERLIATLRDKGALLVKARRHCATKIALNLFWTPAEKAKAMPVPKRKQGILEEQNNESGQPIAVTVADTHPRQIGGYKGAKPATVADNNHHRGGSLKQQGKHHEEQQHHYRRQAPPAGAGFMADEMEELGAVAAVSSRSSDREERVSPAPDPLPIRSPTPASAAASTTAIVKVQAIDTAAKRVSALKAARSKSNAKAYAVTFSAAWEEAFPGIPCPQFSEKDGFVLVSTLNTYLLPADEARHDFLDFAVRNWEAIVADKFKWMTRDPAPRMPSLRFFVTRAEFERRARAQAEKPERTQEPAYNFNDELPPFYLEPVDFPPFNPSAW